MTSVYLQTSFERWLTISYRKSVESGNQLANQTNLALKGIIGISAMAKMAEIAGVEDDQTNFNVRTGSISSYCQLKFLSGHCIALYVDMGEQFRLIR